MPSCSRHARRQLFTATRRLVLANFLLVVCFTATYFVGLIGCATYQLGAGVGSMIYVGTANVAVAVAGQLVTGLGFGAMRPVKDTILQRSCDVSYVGRVTSVMNAGTNSAGTLPLLVAPLVANVLGVQGTLFAASAAVAFLAVVFLLLTRHDGEKDARGAAAGQASGENR